MVIIFNLLQTYIFYTRSAVYVTKIRKEEILRFGGRNFFYDGELWKGYGGCNSND